MSKCEWDATTPYQCLTHNTQWLDDESDRCEYKRMCDAEAAIQRAMDYCNQRRDDKGGDLTALNVIRLLKGTPIVGGQ